MAPRAFLSWSSGKDSAYALAEVRKSGLAEVVGILTTINEAYHRVAMHGVRSSFLDRQAESLGLPCIRIFLPNQCSMALYNARMEQAIEKIKAEEVRHVVFGDLFLEPVRAHREKELARTGMQGVFPLWGRDTLLLAHDMIASGLVAHVVCLDPRHLDRSFAGRRFDHALLAELPPGTDPCGENGEFHTVVSAGPMFRESIPMTIGRIVERDGFVFADAIAPGERCRAIYAP